MIAPVGPVHPEGGPEYVDGSAALVPGHRRLALQGAVGAPDPEAGGRDELPGPGHQGLPKLGRHVPVRISTVKL